MTEKTFRSLFTTSAAIFSLLMCFGVLTQSSLAIGVCRTTSFNGGLLIPFGTSPRVVINGDLDNDGDQDMVVANSGGFSGSTGTISILLNDGAGSFTPGTTLTPNFSPQGVTLADFNLDGVLDVAVGGSNNNGSTSSALAIYYGSINANFRFPVAVNTGNIFISAVASSDLNRDGFSDIVVTTGSNTVLTFINNGGKDFQLASTTSVGSNPRSLVIADFDGDGNLDAATASSNGNNISVLYGFGDGTFQVAVNLPVGTGGGSPFSPATIAVGDLNGDNRFDLVVGGTSSLNVAIFLNNGSGGFNNAVIFNTQLNFFGGVNVVLLGNFTGDSNLDLAVVASGSFSDDPGRIVIFRGNGNGSFDINSPLILPAGSFPVGATTTDFNGDGRSDIATANQSSNNVAVLLSNNTGGFGAPQTSLNFQPTALVTGDFNGDGKLDAIVSNGGGGTSSLVLRLYLGDGNGNFPAQQILVVADNINAQLVAADLNNDSRLDLIVFGSVNVSSSDSIYVYLNNGGATPFGNAPPVPYTFSGTPQSISVGDFNRDGRQDIIAALINSGSVALLLGGANGVFVNPATTFAVATQPTAITVGDFNNDTFLDAAVAGTSSSGGGGSNVVTLLGNGAGAFTQSFVSPALSSSPTGIVSADFNADGRLDTAVVNGNNFSSSIGSISVLLGLGDGRLGSPTNYNVGLNPRTLRIGDFNGDRRPDLAVANRNSNSVSLLINNRAGSFTQPLDILSGVLTNALDVADVNGDGRQDIVAANFFGATVPGNPSSVAGTLTVLTNSCREATTKTDYDGDGRTDFAVFRQSNATWYVLSNLSGNSNSKQFGLSTDIVTPGDYDGDGRTDFAVFRPSSGTWYILRSSNNQIRVQQLGLNGDIPAANDFDGDGRTDIAVFRPSNGTWYILRSTTPREILEQRFGQAGDKPVPADFDGDGRADLAVFRGGSWFILNSANNSFRGVQFGLVTDLPVPGDYDADGKSDVAVYRDGVWYVLNSATNSLRVEPFGLNTDVPQPGDYDNDGRTDFAVFRQSNGTWYVRSNVSGAFISVLWGANGDVPVSSIYRFQ